MKSHLTTIIDRLAKLIEENNPKATYNFERDGAVAATVTYNGEENEFGIKYPKQKGIAVFDSIDLVAIEVYYLIYDEA